MPELIMVASWRVMIVRSPALIRLRKSSEISLEACLDLMSRTISPRALSWSATTCLLSASTSPVALAPVTSIALKTKVDMRLRGRHAAEAHQAAQLFGGGRTRLCEALGDLAVAHERGQRGVHA